MTRRAYASYQGRHVGTCPSCSGPMYRFAKACNVCTNRSYSVSRKSKRVPQDPAEYIAARVKAEDRGHDTPCLIWQMWTTEKGYARADVPGCGRVRVHRVAYELKNGPIPDGLVTDHLCRVTSCVNPDHLEAVTVAENNRRAAPFHPNTGTARLRPARTDRKRGTATVCHRGHEKVAGERCRECNRANARAWKIKNPEKRAEQRRRYRARKVK